MKKYLFTSCIVLLFFILSCKKESGGGGSDGGVQINCSTVTFSGNIAPLIASRCATSGCHDASSTNGPGPLINHASIFASRLSIQSAVNANRMPQGGPALSAEDKARIKCWIDAGAPNN
jgi:hypothetical protein